MKKHVRLFAISLSLALVAGGLASFSHFKAPSAPIEAKADSEPNSTFSYIYSDDYNNTTQNSALNKVMIVYNGTAHGLTESINGDGLAAFDNHILLNGNPLSSYANAQISPWGGQKWIQFFYPKTAAYEGATFEFKTGLQLGDAVFEGFTLKLNSSNKWGFTFTDPVNATYSKIYNDDFNNASASDTLNKVLIVYNGPAHNHPDAIAGKDLKLYEQYIKLDGTPISSLSGAQIAPWGGQLWIQILYPKASLATGSTLEISEGCKIGDAVFEKIILVLNSNSKWQKVNLIADDELVRNNDYMLFTPADFLGGSNDTWHFFLSVGGVSQLNNLNFGIQYKMTLTDEQLGGYQTLRFGTSLTGYEYAQLLINYKVNTYINSFKGVNSNISSSIASINVAAGTHTYEFYSIKVGENSVRFLFGIDGLLIFKTDSLDATGASCSHIAIHVGTTGAPASAYSSCDTTKVDALNRFGKNKLHSEDIAFDNNANTGACAGENGYYAKAKAFYNTYLTPNQQKEFATNASYENLRNRIVAWGAANGEAVSFNASTGALVISSNRINVFHDHSENIAVIIVAITMAALSMAMMFYHFLKKKKYSK